MNKITLKQIIIELKRSNIGIDYNEIEFTPWFNVYHHHEWDHGYENWNGIKVYLDGSYETERGYIGTRREFYIDMRDIINFLMEYFKHNEINEFIIAPCFRYNQFTNNAEKNDIYNEIYSFLKTHKIKRGERSGVKLFLDGNEKIIEMIIEGSFRDVSSLCIFIPNNNLLIVPSHHFSLTFYSQKINKEKVVVKEILSRHKNLYYYDNLTDI